MQVAVLRALYDQKMALGLLVEPGIDRYVLGAERSR